MRRRDFIRSTAGIVGGLGMAGLMSTQARAASERRQALFSISLAEWSLHKALYAQELDNLDFVRTAKRDFGIEAVEYVNVFFKDKARDQAYLREMKTRAEGEGVRSVLIMCDGEGNLGDPDPDKRTQAVENHKQWVEASKFLGGHAIRVNARSEGTYAEQQQRAADGLRRLCEFADPFEISVVVENHGGYSSNGEWLAGVMDVVDHPRCGTLPDFGNFNLGGDTWYDRYKGVTELMPYAKAVSAKSYDFDEDGACVETDYVRMMKIVLDAGYRGFVGIEYEGSKLSEPDGIRATKALLERIRTRFADTYNQ